MKLRGAIGGCGLAVALLLLGGCSASRSSLQIDSTAKALSENTESTINATGAQASLLDGPDTSIAHRQAMGDRFAALILQKSSTSDDDVVERELNELAANLAKRIENSKFTYKVHLLDDEKPNAFTTGGGHLFVTTGLAGVLKSQGQMAMVLAHEMAHNELAHVVKGIHGRELAKRAAAFNQKVLDKKLGLTWIGNSVDFLVATGLNSYTRDQEDEADLYGLQFIVAAGFDPYVAPRAVLELSGGSAEKSQVENFFSGRHPTSKMRIWRLNNLIKAHFYRLDSSSMKRSSDDYDRAMQPYWSS